MRRGGYLFVIIGKYGLPAHYLR